MPPRGLAIPPRILDGDFSGWLRDALKARRMSYRMLAVQAGVDHTTVQRLVAGDRLPSLATAISIIRVMDGGELRGVGLPGAPFPPEAGAVTPLDPGPTDSASVEPEHTG
jgi:DNA-binding XRE family transcriptional regulator